MKKALAILATVFLLVTMIPIGAVSVSAAMRTREEAVQWALSKVGHSLDYDGQYEAQCVDLIYHYYAYLGVQVMGGNASNYEWNALPSGWQRITVVPGVTQLQSGDIAVWKPGYSYNGYSTPSAGHVGIIIDSDSVGFMAVEQRAYGSTLYTWFPLQTLSCIIRPSYVEPHVHSWSEWSVSKTATCIVDGEQIRTCGCGVSEKQVVPATGKHIYDDSCDATCNMCGEKREVGHNFTMVEIEATCSQYGKRIYTCDDCAYSYEEIIAEYVSDWSTEYPSDVNEKFVESKTEYRYRDEEWKETTTPLGGDWILKTSYTQLSEYGEWSEWVNSAISANTYTQVETHTAYTYYYFLCPGCGAHMHVSNQCYSWAGGCGKYTMTGNNWVPYYSTTSYDAADLWEFHGTGKYAAYVDGQLVFRHENGAVTQYRSRTRQMETVYLYYRYTDWTEWSDVYDVSNEMIEERTVYRYVVADLDDHTYDDEYDADCNVCGGVREVPEKPPVTPDLPADAPAFVVDSVSASAGKEVIVAIRTERNSGIVSLKLGVSYDTAVLELIDAEGKDFEGTSFGPITNVPFVVNWFDALSPNNTTDGVVVLLTFRVKEDASLGKTDITLSYDAVDVFDQHFNDVAFRTVNGYVEVVEYTIGDVNNDGNINNRDLAVFQQYLNGWEVTVNEAACDVYADGNVNNRDLALLQQYLNGWDVTLG